MSTLLRDNALALTLGGCCLLFSAWLYLSEAPDRSAAVAQAQQAADKDKALPQADALPLRPGRRPAAVAQEVSRSGGRKDAPAQAADELANAPALQLDGLHLSPADWQSAPR
jgi:hypothetical protein